MGNSDQSNLVKAALVAGLAGAAAGALAATARLDARRRSAPAEAPHPGLADVGAGPGPGIETGPNLGAGPALADEAAAPVPSTTGTDDYHLAMREQIVSLVLRVIGASYVLLALVAPFIIGETDAVARRMWALMPWIEPGTALALLGGIAVLIVALGLDQHSGPGDDVDPVGLAGSAGAGGAGGAGGTGEPHGRTAAAVRLDIQHAVLAVSSVAAIGVGLAVVLWAVVAWTGNLPDTIPPTHGTLIATAGAIAGLAVLLARVGISTVPSRRAVTRAERDRVEAAMRALPGLLRAANDGLEVPRRWLVWPWPMMWAPTVLASAALPVLVAIVWDAADLPLKFLAFVPLVALQSALAAGLSIDLAARRRARVHLTFTGSVGVVVLAAAVLAVGLSGAAAMATAGAPVFRWTIVIATVVPTVVVVALAAWSAPVRRRLAVHGELVRTVPGLSVTYRHAYVSRLHHS